jgi:hypothetical protein
MVVEPREWEEIASFRAGAVAPRCKQGVFQNLSATIEPALGCAGLMEHSVSAQDFVLFLFSS